MNVNNPDLYSRASMASAGKARPHELERTDQKSQSANGSAGVPASGDDMHLSELVRSLRALTADSPERQARIEQLARSYANGTYRMDSEGTASKMVDEGLDS
jgi:flagellar biosynthesis anti-sigma factor FlgM